MFEPAVDQFRAGRSRVWLAILAKLLLAVGVFAAIVGGWSALRIHRDRATPLPGYDVPVDACTLWFIGSSSIQRWPHLEDQMHPWSAVNRGLFAARLGYIHRRMLNEPAGRHPAAIVFYGGDNDIAAGRSAADAFAGTQDLFADMRRRFGRVPIFMISLKPSPARWSNFARQSGYNADLRRFAATHAGLHFVDTVPALLRGARPGPFYDADGIHMNAAGYAITKAALDDAIAQKMPRAILDHCLAARKAHAAPAHVKDAPAAPQR